jgi:diguanylate cyclase (GGDEF)-like protein/PAS domain S-box-containing protein
VVRRDLGRLHELHRDVIAVIAVIDKRGDIIANSMPTPVVSVADLPHFRAHVDADSGKPFFGQPLLGRVSKRWSMHLSRRVNAPDGSFAGVVTAAISLDYLKRFYQSVSLGKSGVIQLIGDDGIVRVRSSDDGTSAGQNVSGAKLFRDFRAGHRRGTYNESSPLDAERSIVSYRAVEGQPLVVAVSIGEKAVLDQAQAIARNYYLGAGGITLLLAVMFTSTGLMVQRQRRIARELIESEHRLSLAQEGSDQALFDWNVVTGEVYLSERWNEMMGGARKPVHTSFDELSRLVHPDDIAGQKESIVAALKSGARYRREHRVRTHDGTWIWIQSHGKVTARDAQGRALRMVGYNADITARKVSQLALADSERSYANLVKNISGVVYRCRNDLDWTIEFISERCLEVTGFRADEFLRNRVVSLGSLMHPDDAGPIWQKCQASLAERKACSNEYRIIHRSGEIRWVWDRAQGVYSDSGELLSIEGLLSDITERKRAEAEMTREQGLLRTIIDTVPDYIYVKDADGRFSVANKAWLKDRNLADKSVAGKTVFDVFPAELAGRMAAQDADIVATGMPILDFEQRVTVRAPEGGRSEPKWFAVTKVPMADASGKIIGTVGISRDITERKLSAQRREMEHAVTQLLAESASVEEAMPRLLRAMCQAMNWSYGARWVCNSEGIHRADYWADFEPEFDPADGDLWLRQGVEGSMVLLRQAWQHKKPTWIVDVDQLETFRRRVSARKFGLHGAFAFPIVVGGDVICIMEFFGHEAREPDEMLLQGVRAIGSQLGQFIQRKETEQALRESEKQFRQLAGNIPQVFWICDAHRHSAIYVSPAFREITGLDPENLKVRAHGWLDAVHPDDRQQVVAARTQAGTGKYDQTFRIVKPDGSVRWVRDRAFPVYDASGTVYRIAGICEDITEKKAAEERLAQLAHFDILTGLPNRALYLDRMRQAMTLARRHDRATGVMFLDLDRFKLTNDTLGHSAGDQLLKQVGERLATCVREGDTVGRFGGDEFGIILADMRSPEDARLVAQKVINVLDPPFLLDGHEVFITASIGISLYPADSDDETELMKNADTAMYRAKESGRNRYEFYSREMNVRSLQRLTLESNLRRALERGEFLLHYQPKASLVTREITGFEALLRWAPGGQKLVSPADFVPLLEDTGLIVPVGEWVIEAACRQLLVWRDAGVRLVPVAVNLSARQFREKHLAANIERILRAHGIDPRFIEIEITESSLMSNTDEAARTLSRLKSLGLRLSIDDFGTGYSSLAYLRRFPLDTLKIDRSFVNEVTTNADGANITRAVIGMSHNLGLRVVAEGVETEAQLAFLYAAGCGEMQGYYFSRPLPAEESLQWLRDIRLLRGSVVAATERTPAKQER